MRGEKDRQEMMLSTLTPETVVPPSHPIRKIKAVVDEQLAGLDSVFEKVTPKKGGRPFRRSGW